MNKIKISRSSSLPNGKGSYAYRVLTPITPEMGLSGVYTTTDGVTLIYSPNMVGELNKPFTCDCIIRTVNEKKYINLIDVDAEIAGQFGKMFNQATKAGFVNNATFAQAFINNKIGNQATVQTQAPAAAPAVQAEPAVVVEEPVTEQPIVAEAPATAEVVTEG